MGVFDFLFSKGKNNKQQKNASDDNSHLLEMTTTDFGLTIPKAFLPYANAIAATKRDFISIKANPSKSVPLYKSSFGSYPFMPKDVAYPKDAAGNYMFPLAQINFSEIPPLENYPASGFLQIYITANDEDYLYGVNFDCLQQQKNFRILFFESDDIKKFKDDFSFLASTMQENTVPIQKGKILSFEKKMEYFGVNDVQYENNKDLSVDIIASKYPDIQDELQEFVYDNFSSNGHKIGGYAYFTQEDPRKHNEEIKDYILLLQMDTDEDMMWGDVGVANFFIHPNDLAKKDFSKVVYTWDCG
jgi:uncharacterized protein YwqG